jgi:hypothetical protein
LEQLNIAAIAASSFNQQIFPTLKELEDSTFRELLRVHSDYAYSPILALPTYDPQFFTHSYYTTWLSEIPLYYYLSNFPFKS